MRFPRNVLKGKHTLFCFSVVPFSIFSLLSFLPLSPLYVPHIYAWDGGGREGISGHRSRRLGLLPFRHLLHLQNHQGDISSIGCPRDQSQGLPTQHSTTRSFQKRGEKFHLARRRAGVGDIYCYSTVCVLLMACGNAKEGRRPAAAAAAICHRKRTDLEVPPLLLLFAFLYYMLLIVWPSERARATSFSFMRCPHRAKSYYYVAVSTATEYHILAPPPPPKGDGGVKTKTPLCPSPSLCPRQRWDICCVPGYTVPPTPLSLSPPPRSHPLSPSPFSMLYCSRFGKLLLLLVVRRSWRRVGMLIIAPAVCNAAQKGDSSRKHTQIAAFRA